MARLLPRGVRARIRGRLDSPRLRRRVRPVRWGNLRRIEPFSVRYGFDRGTPVDRYYLEAFFRDRGSEIAGTVLEVKNPEFSGRYGRNVRKLDLVDIDAANDSATIIADLVDAESLPANTFDCVIVPQTLQLVTDPDAAVINLWQSIAPGGVLLATVPAVSKRDHHLAAVDRWRFMPAGLADLLSGQCLDGDVEVFGYGNLLAATAFLHGIAAEELLPRELDTHDPAYPILACGRARKPGR
jgi:SAM-dependent methyltransferase